MSLPDLAVALQAIMPDKKVDVINLDGGSSTSFASTKLAYNEGKSLPIFFHSCK